MSAHQTIPVLSLGAMVGGTTAETRAWKDAVTRLGRRVRELREGVDSPLNVNVVYQIPGDVVRVDFQGVRTGRYSQTDRHLLVQAALPAEIPENPEAKLLELLQQAITKAEQFAHEREITHEPLHGLRALISAL